MKNKEISFEEALKELEETVQAMESGELGLECLLEKFETGIGLLRHCEGKLGEAEAKIEVLSKKATAKEENTIPAKKKATKNRVNKIEDQGEALQDSDIPDIDDTLEDVLF